MYYKTSLSSPVGNITLACDDNSILGLWLEGQKYFGGQIISKADENDSLPVFKKTNDWLSRYFNKEKPKISELPLNPQGSDFRKCIWRLLTEIPYGEVTTYGSIAKKASEILKTHIGGRAVGGAVGHNPISIIIPCHRVIGANGKLTGYAGGLEIKEKLLFLEEYK